jgi:hypothetical protein
MEFMNSFLISGSAPKPAYEELGEVVHPKGKVILNPELIKAPKESIEYVIIHDTCIL